EDSSTWQPDGPCSSCTCVNGETVCAPVQCPPTECLHPTKITGETLHDIDISSADRCAPWTSGSFTCDLFPAGCLYQDRERANGETWDDPSDPCAVCVCREGSVQCERKRCPPSNCNHPVRRDCCMSCEGEGTKPLTFADGQDPCGVCYCYGGDITCTKLPCYGDCSHPYKPPGQCCGECEHSKESCLYQGTVYHSDEQWELDECTSCTCVSGDVHCRSERCPPLTCAAVSIQHHPVGLHTAHIAAPNVATMPVRPNPANLFFTLYEVVMCLQVLQLQCVLQGFKSAWIF
uniref:VWFC domain-containing protein n=1 Tax=Fundulus heteroclitus TaxID=8078 RepID=A0A3Q2NUX4_FUNHE